MLWDSQYDVTDFNSLKESQKILRSLANRLAFIFDATLEELAGLFFNDPKTEKIWFFSANFNREPKN
jgi:hypothetical protein